MFIYRCYWRRYGKASEHVAGGGDATRLRLLLLLTKAELTVSEITSILGQSQPRVSRHLRLLCEAGLLERFKEGAWVFYRAAEQAKAVELARAISTLADVENDPVLIDDRRRLTEVRTQRARKPPLISGRTHRNGSAFARCMCPNMMWKRPSCACSDATGWNPSWTRAPERGACSNCSPPTSSAASASMSVRKCCRCARSAGSGRRVQLSGSPRRCLSPSVCRRSAGKRL